MVYRAVHDPAAWTTPGAGWQDRGGPQDLRRAAPSAHTLPPPCQTCATDHIACARRPRRTNGRSITASARTCCWRRRNTPWSTRTTTRRAITHCCCAWTSEPIGSIRVDITETGEAGSAPGRDRSTAAKPGLRPRPAATRRGFRACAGLHQGRAVRHAGSRGLLHQGRLCRGRLGRRLYQRHRADDEAAVLASPERRQGGESAMSVVTTEERGPISIIRINRPEKLNAISAAVAVELQQRVPGVRRRTGTTRRHPVRRRRPRVHLRRRRHRPAGAVARHPRRRLPDRQADHRGHLRLVRRRRHRDGDDVRPDGLDRRARSSTIPRRSSASPAA